MERLKIPMFSRFDAISHIMPYYSQTHEAFLLLSGLCSKTRSKLDEFYDEFVNLMIENWRYIETYSTRQNTHNFFFRTIYLKFLLISIIKNPLTHLLNSSKTWETPKGGTLTVTTCIRKLRSEILLLLGLIPSRLYILTLVSWNQYKWFYAKGTSIILKLNMSQVLSIQIAAVLYLNKEDWYQHA